MAYIPDQLVKEHYHNETTGPKFRAVYDDIVEEFGNPKDLSSDPAASKPLLKRKVATPVGSAGNKARKLAKEDFKIEDPQHVPGEQTKYAAW